MTPDVFLAPVLALIMWTCLIWILMYARRIPAMQASKADIELAKSPDGPWKEALPLKVQAAAHNYNHLLEQPTVFYALMFYLALTDCASNIILYLAWTYVVLRVLHSFIQVSAGRVVTRFSIFALSTLVLFGMVGLAVLS